MFLGITTKLIGFASIVNDYIFVGILTLDITKVGSRFL